MIGRIVQIETRKRVVIGEVVKCEMYQNHNIAILLQDTNNEMALFEIAPRDIYGKKVTVRFLDEEIALQQFSDDDGKKHVLFKTKLIRHPADTRLTAPRDKVGDEIVIPDEEVRGPKES